MFGLFLYALAAAVGFWAFWRGRVGPDGSGPPPRADPKWTGRVPRFSWLVLSLGRTVLAFADAGGNQFRLPGLVAWAVAVVAWFAAWWNEPIRPSLDSVRRPFHVGWWHLLAIGVPFRYWDLDGLPHDVNSDHVEKLLDVRDVLAGD